MSRATLHRALDAALDLAGPSLTVELSGGEPLLVPALVREALSRLRRPAAGGPRLVRRLKTNGLLLDTAMVDLLAAHDVALQLSFDGPRAQDRQRGGRTFAKLDRLLRAIRRRHPDYWRRRVGVAAVFTPETVGDLPAVAAYFLARDVRQFALAPVCGLPAWGEEACATLADRLQAVYDLAAAHRSRSGDSELRLPCRATRAAARAAPAAVCGAGLRACFTVDARGDVHGCVQLARAAAAELAPRTRRLARALAHGNVGEADFTDRWLRRADPARGLPVLRSRAGWTSGGRSCAACPLVDDCRVCPLAGQVPGEVPDAHCLVTRVVHAQHGRWQAAGDLVDEALRAIL